MNINLTLIGQMVAFVFFVLFCMKYVWPPILAAMKERTEKIADGLAAADRANHDLELAQEKAVERLKEAKTLKAGQNCVYQKRRQSFRLHTFGISTAI